MIINVVVLRYLRFGRRVTQLHNYLMEQE